MTYTIADDVQRNCPKYVEIYSKNKFENLVHIFCFIIRIYHNARSPERQISLVMSAVRLSIRKEQCDSHRTDCREIPYVGFLLQIVGTFRFWFKQDKNKTRHMERYVNSDKLLQWLGFMIESLYACWGTSWGWRESWRSKHKSRDKYTPPPKKKKISRRLRNIDYDRLWTYC